MCLELCQLGTIRPRAMLAGWAIMAQLRADGECPGRPESRGFPAGRQRQHSIVTLALELDGEQHPDLCPNFITFQIQ